MSAELTVQTPTMPAVVDPRTGEAVVLAEAATDTLAAFLENVREVESAFREQKRAVSREILDRMDREARWTGRVGEFEIKGDGPTPPTEYDAEALYWALDEFVAAGVITDQARDEAVERVEVFKAKARGIQALRKLGGGVAAVIDRHAREAVRERRVSVKRRVS
jgi:hypothetical protein